MEEIKRRFIDTVAECLSAAPQSAEKEELVEELSDNLYRRFLDMTNAGMEEEAAFARSMEDLGDVDELLSYLGVEPAAQPGGQARIDMSDPHRIVINGEDSGRIVINGPDGHRQTIVYGQQDQKAAQEEAGTPGRSRKRLRTPPEGRKDGWGDTHYDHQAPQGDLDAILAGVSAACNTAIDQAKTALQQAKEAIKRRTSWEKENSRVTVHFNTHPDPAEAPVPPEPPEAPEAPEAPEPPKGWEFEAELDADEGRFFAGAGPKEKTDVVYGFGYDKTRGGFFAQWGEYQGEGPEGKGPRFTGEDASMEGNEDGSYSVSALRDLRGIEVFTVAGDVSVHLSEAPDAGVIIDGDVDELDVTCSADGVLTIREGRTASSSFFSRRGFCSADVELYLPRRHWEMISISTTSGDVDIDRDGLDIGQLSVTTMSGDLNARLRACAQLHFKSSSGDLSLELEGACGELRAETVSGDIELQGPVESAFLKSASGDIELEGPAGRFMAAAISGDVRLDTAALPQAMELSSKSGDVEARLPDAGPFSAHIKTTSGELNCQFPMNYINGMFLYGEGGGPAYSMTTVSGDISLERR